MLLENQPYPQDVRVRPEATTLVRAGHRVQVIAPRMRSQPRRERLDGVLVERYWLPHGHSGSSINMIIEYLVAHLQLYWRGLRALLRGTDVIHVHNPPDLLFPLGLLARSIGCRFVFDQHDLFPELVAERYGNRPLAWLARRMQRMSQRVADLVITTNLSQRDAALADRNCSRDGVIVVRNALPGSWLGYNEERRIGTLKDPHLVYVGVLERQDGADALPAVMSMLVNDHGLAGARLTVVGPGSQLESLKAQVAEQGLSGHVNFTGGVPHAQALESIGVADICLDVAPCNDFNHQSTMVKIVEYLTLGKPVVSFPLNETIRLGGDAIAYAPCDDLGGYARVVARLAESEKERSELVDRARKVAKGLVWERSAEALLEGYRMLERARR
jgi:glycosyltransferase involved in cell wall biosynthesis